MDKSMVSSLFVPTCNSLTLDVKLGEGAFGIVYRAIYLGDYYAIKQLYVNKTNKHSQQKFQHEIDIMAKLRSPNIVSIYNHISVEPYTIVMEYMPKGSLYELLKDRDNPFEWSLRYAISVDIGKGIRFLHDEKIIHRNLKSFNVLLDDQFHAKLSDFGLTKLLEDSDHTVTDNAISWPWTAPELLEGKPATFASDIYAYGMILWEIVARRLPFANSNEATLVKKVTSGEREKIPTSAPLLFQQAIYGAWQQKPEQRLNMLTLLKLLNKSWQQHAEQTLNTPATTSVPAKHLSNAANKQELMLVNTPSTTFSGPHYQSKLSTLALSFSFLPPPVPGEADYLQGRACLEKCQYQLAFPYLEKAAKAGYPPSYLWLSWLYSNGGRIGPKNLDKKQYYAAKIAEHFNWFLQAVQSGKAPDQCNLGLCYANGYGVKQDLIQAAAWYQKAAKQDYASAQFVLGWCYSNGQGVEQNFEQAIIWYQKAAAQGHASAQCNLGICYYCGLGVKQDFDQAISWYQKAIDQSYTNAQYNLGLCYINGRGVKQDFVKAFEWFQKAAYQGDADAEYSLGWCYANGQGTIQNFVRAVVWYQNAAYQGHAGAQYNLGVCYANGQGVQQDFTQAVIWCQRAAYQGHLDAQFNIGWCYANACGVKKNIPKAVVWLQTAAKNGHADAQIALKALLQQYPHLQPKAPTSNASTFFSAKSSQPPANNSNATARPHDDTDTAQGTVKHLKYS